MIMSKMSNVKKEIDLSSPSTLIIDNPNFCFGADGFLLNNQDCYIGDFCCSKKGIVWREGQGIYVTADNHSYEGIWENDQLIDSEETIVGYPDGSEYRGQIKNGKYSGAGIYTFKDKVQLTANFEDNEAVGDVVLRDSENHVWRGQIKESEGLLMPENHFYTSLTYDKGLGSRKEKSLILLDPIHSYSSVSGETEMEKDIFKKSTKTKNDCFKRHRTLLTKKNSEKLPKKDPEIDKWELFNIYMSKAFRNQSIPVSTYYATKKTSTEEEIATKHENSLAEPTTIPENSVQEEITKN